MSNRYGTAVWRAAYRLEEARQASASKGQLLRQAAYCIGLALLRLWPK